MELQGDKGARKILEANEDLTIKVEADTNRLRDIDTKEDIYAGREQ